MHVVGARMQLPAPLQLPMGVKVVSTQLAVPQGTFGPGISHAVSAPLHRPWQASTPGQALRAGVLPVMGAPTTGTHVPSMPGCLHELHWATQSLSQQ
jgi:hypothetical protein